MVDGTNQSVGEIITGPSPFDDLPEDCISNIVAFTSPRDACVSSSVSKTFESAARSDSVWEKFLPLDYTSLAPASGAFSSKRELYFALCDHFLIEDGKKVCPIHRFCTLFICFAHSDPSLD